MVWTPSQLEPQAFKHLSRPPGLTSSCPSCPVLHAVLHHHHIAIHWMSPHLLLVPRNPHRLSALRTRHQALPGKKMACWTTHQLTCMQLAPVVHPLIARGHGGIVHSSGSRLSGPVHCSSALSCLFSLPSLPPFSGAGPHPLQHIDARLQRDRSSLPIAALSARRRTQDSETWRNLWSRVTIDAALATGGRHVHVVCLHTTSYYQRVTNAGPARRPRGLGRHHI